MLRSVLAGLLFAALAACSSQAPAQSVPLQGGPWTNGHAPMYSNSGNSQPVIQDSGPASGGAVGLGMGEGLYVARGTGTPPYADQGTGPNGENWCDYDAPITNATGYHYLCLSPNAEGGGLISYGAGGGASEQPLQFLINGDLFDATPGSPSGAAGGDLSGTYPNPTVAKVHGVTYPASPSTGTVPIVTGSNTVTYSTASTTINGVVCSLAGSCTVSIPQYTLVTDPSIGAACNGVTNDTTAIQAALTAGKSIGIPNATCIVTGLTINHDGQAIVGISPQGSILKNSTASTPTITIAGFLTGVQVRNIGCDRTPTATSGGSCIDASVVNTDHFLSNIYSNHNYDGFLLGPCGFCYLQNALTVNSLRNGLRMQNTAVNGAMQWVLFNNLFQTSAGDGVAVVSVAGPAQVTMGNWTQTSTALNSGHGVAFYGLPGVPIQSIRVLGGFIGDDGDSEIYLDTYGTLHEIDNVFAELAGKFATGPGLGTPASGVGSGIEITANNIIALVRTPIISGNSEYGIDSSASVFTQLIGASITGNSLYGAHFANGAKMLMTSTYFLSNTSGTILYDTNSSSAVSNNNFPVVTTNNLGQIAGTNTNSSANVGNVGEITASTVASGSAVALTTATPANITSISLTAGDWDVTGQCSFTGNVATTVSYNACSVSATSATLAQANGQYATQTYGGGTIFNGTADAIVAFATAPVRVTLAATTTYYLVTQSGFAVNSNSAYGVLRARRMR